MDKHGIMSRALRHGFTLRQQPGGEMDLNPYVYSLCREMFEAGRNAGRKEAEAAISARSKASPQQQELDMEGFGPPIPELGEEQDLRTQLEQYRATCAAQEQTINRLRDKLRCLKGRS